MWLMARLLAQGPRSSTLGKRSKDAAAHKATHRQTIRNTRHSTARYGTSRHDTHDTTRLNCHSLLSWLKPEMLFNLLRFNLTLTQWSLRLRPSIENHLSNSCAFWLGLGTNNIRLNGKLFINNSLYLFTLYTLSYQRKRTLSSYSTLSTSTLFFFIEESSSFIIFTSSLL